MTDSQLSAFASNGTLPKDLTVADLAMNRLVGEALAQTVSEERKRRQAESQSRMDVERRKREEAEELRKHPRDLFGQRIVTKDMYDQLREGMSYAQVKDIVGFPGEELSSVELGGISTKMYMWQNMGGSNMNVTFQNGRLIAKAQFRL